ncbi:ribose operon repressor [Lactobacillus plantarum JDM1] [Lactiplantibacillus mudanjiangensis]|uniref:ribose utilization transcriptional repressor RbsR n=1 Tax=Lactiplantibacillus mudanjiangensis TaxID=1296538 RepID=UPI00101460F9|nr:substrate-binding domain-containing protein [Lactiplantibacillus mudanjiangensis]VDG31735.1 ribose operon repressor [Lactobacillus plantarum JDM1] [Lactiplantibacillus mudanjiangensis]
MKNKAVTIKDVARRSGVSIATVSQILNGNGDKFSPTTVEKVEAAKADLHYEPDYFAQRMINKKSKTIGVLVPDITNPFFSELIRGIEDVLYQANFITMLCNADLNEAKEQVYLSELSRRGVDGFIIASSAVSNQAITDILRRKQHPFIVLDQKKAEGVSDAVLTDDYAGGRQAAQHLQSLGHQEVAVLMPAHAAANIQKRLAGFYSVYDQANVHVIATALSKKAGREAVPAVMATPATAIFAVSDQIAFGVYLGLAENGRQIPQDYSVIGYDDVEMCQYVVPQLTTIAQPIFELGQTTAKQLLARIAEPTLPWQEQQLAVKLVERASTNNLK